MTGTRETHTPSLETTVMPPPARWFGRATMCLALALLVLDRAAAAEPAPPQEAPRVKQFLSEAVGFDPSQLAALERGEVISRIIETKGELNVAVFGAVTLNTSRERFVERAVDFRKSVRAPTRVQLGLFGAPATAADVRTLRLTDQDVKDLKDCSPNDCKLKLPAFLMRKAQEEIRWSGTDVPGQVNAFCQARVVAYANDYRVRGDSALTYDNVGTVRASDAFTALLAEAPYVYEVQRPMIDYLKQYPHGRLEGVQEALFWCMDSLKGLKPILSVNHMLVYAPSVQPGVTMVASKQIYADRYLEAMLDLTAVAERATPDGKSGAYLLRLRRLRFDRLPSGGLVNVRGKVKNAMRDQMVSDLGRIKVMAEEAAR